MKSPEQVANMSFANVLSHSNAARTDERKGYDECHFPPVTVRTLSSVNHLEGLASSLKISDR